MYDIVIGRSAGDREKFGSDGVIFVGKHYVKMGQTVSLSNSVYLDVIRSHVVFVCGKRGGGKCLTGDTLITLEDGREVPISALEGEGTGVLSLSSELKIGPAAREGFYKRSVSRILSLRTRTGREIRLTPEHPLLTVRGWVPARDLCIDDRIATPRKTGVFGENAMEEARVKILAYLIAEGHLGNRFVLFSNTDPEIVADFRQAVLSFDRTLRIVQHSKEGCLRAVQNKKRYADITRRDSRGRTVSSRQRDCTSSIRGFCEREGMYGKLSYEKTLPDSVFTLTRQRLSLFLNRLFSSDGCIYQKHPPCWTISYCSSSRELAKQVQSLLLRFGVVSRLREKKTKCRSAYELEVYAGFVRRFIREIGFFGRKEKRARQALADNAEIVRNTNVDTIPREIWESFEPDWPAVGRMLGYKIPKSARESARYSPSRHKLMQVAQAMSDNYLATMADSDIFWDSVSGIEEIEGTFDVYDITVPGAHNFVANNIIVHNSYSMGVIAEGMADLPEEIRQNLSIVLLDTMGVYWSMKYPNRKEEAQLKEWGMQGRGMNVQIYTPAGFHDEFRKKGIPTDFPFSIKPSELDAGDWCLTFEIDINSPMGVLIERVISEMQKRGEYQIVDVIDTLRKDKESEKGVRDAVTNRFRNADSWGLFSEKGTPLVELAGRGQITVLDVSCYSAMPNSWGVKSLVIGLVSKKLFIQRMVARKMEEYEEIHETMHYFEDVKQKQELPLIWLVVDEAHEFLPNKGKTAATDPLITILREGRQPGISLILASQQPGKIHTDVMTQADTVISHRLTSKIDIDALSLLMQSYMRSGLNTIIDDLPRVKGAAIVFDDTNERMYPIQVRPRLTWHGGESPVAYHKKKKTFEFLK